jgi:hypothetical protein
MKYKELILTKLEALNNSINGIESLLSRPNLTKQDFDRWHSLVKSKLEEITTLVNSEQQSF